jgi:RNA polymerase sigma-70 factor (ECF subfamily)
VPDLEAQARFSRLYDEYYTPVYGYVVSRAGSRLAEDIASEAFGLAWQQFSDLPEQPLPWLLRLARQVIRKSIRTEERQAALVSELEIWAGEVGDDVAIGVIDRAANLRGLAALSDADREVLTLVAWHGLTPGEAASVVGCTSTAFFVRLHRARKRLAKAIDEQARVEVGR